MSELIVSSRMKDLTGRYPCNFYYLDRASSVLQSLRIIWDFKDFSHTSRAPECYRILIFTASDLGPKTLKTCAKSSIFDTFLSVSN